VSPDGRWIVYVRDLDSVHTELRRVAPDGSGDTSVASFAGGDVNPFWSPDGRSILLAHTEGDTAQLLTIRADGSDRRRIVSIAGKSARLSPDGRRVAYSRGAWTRNRIVVADREGAHAAAITDSSAGYFNLAWSPAGDRIAATRLDSSRVTEVWIMNADGSNARSVASFARADGRPQWPAWSPDGKRLAIQAGRYDRAHPELDSAYLWVIDLATGKATRLGAHDAPRIDETPAWFPDGKRLVYQSSASGRFEVWVMNADGTGARQVTR
jgi:TolB protein